jgi:DNA-binding PucR family transcriptional regulator
MHDVSIADIRQGSAYGDLLARAVADLDPLVAGVVHDTGDEPDRARRSVARFVHAVARAPRLDDAELLLLREEGSSAARAGESVQQAIDRYLTAAWVLWGAATAVATSRDAAALGALGAALLRAADDAAAALAEGYNAAERALATRAATTRRAVLDELLLPAADPAAAARVRRRAALVGLDPNVGYRVVIARTGVDIEDEAPYVDAWLRGLEPGPGRPPSLAAVRDGHLVAVLSDDWREGPIDAAFGALSRAGTWTAVRSERVDMPRIPEAYAAARDAVSIAARLGLGGRVVDAADLDLERALAADQALLGAGVERWLGPLLDAPRGGVRLVETLEAWLAAGQSVVATARSLEIAPRTVTYRLERAASLLRLETLEGAATLRIATALLGRRLLAGTERHPGPDATMRGPAAAPPR